MAEVATAAGVSHLIVYRHFESKHALYDAVLERARSVLDAALADRDAAGRYGPAPSAMLTAARADPHGFRVMWRHAVREPDFVHHPDGAREFMHARSAEAQAPIVSAEHRQWAARATVSFLVDSVLAWIEDGDERLDDRFVAATEAAMRAGVRSWAKPT